MIGVAKKLIVPCVVGWVAACAAAPSLDNAHQAAMRDSVFDFFETYRGYSEAGAWDSLLALYADTPSFRWMEDGEVRYRSVREIREALAGMPPGLRIETVHDDVEVTPLAPGLAWVVMRFQTEFVDSIGPRFSFQGGITMVVEHGSTGWRIVGGHASSPRPRDAAN
jgi:hypothetical protein